MQKNFLRIAFLIAGFSVVLGAFAAHGLKNILSAASLNTFETAVKYQFYHAFGIMITAILYKEFLEQQLIWAGRLFLIGIILFSGSLYCLALLSPSFQFLGIITPFGGLCFILGWLTLFFSVNKKEKKEE